MKIQIAIFTVLFSLCLPAHADHVDANYGYPISDPYFATLSSELNGLGKFEYTERKLVLLPERAHIKNEKRYQFIYTYNLHNPDAPLVFVLAGLGGNAESGTTLMLAKLMQAEGYNTVTLPNAFSWGFVLSGSRTGLVGYPPTDAVDLYDAMKAVHNDLVQNRGLRASRFAVMGYSMGGLETGFLLERDRKEKYFNFARAVMINSPFTLHHGVAVLDEMYSQSMQLSQERRDWDFGYIYDFIGQAQTWLQQGKAPQDILAKFKLRQADAVWLIADDFRESLRDVILSSQEVNDLGILKTPPKYMNAREAEAQATTFHDYLEKYFYPSLHTDQTIDAILDSGSLTTLFDQFQNDPAAYLLHNADDFLFEPGLNDTLNAKLGDRFTLFPHGGHMGNLWFPDNQILIMKIMANL